MHIVLGSSSPRRREIFSFFSLPFTQESPPFDESLVKFDGCPIRYVEQISIEKNRSLQSGAGRLVITSDTTVHCDGKIYGKPANPAEAEKMLLELQGRWHEVFSAITVSLDGKEITRHEFTRVKLTPLTKAQIRIFQRKCGALDKAGGYAIQKEGAIIVDRIEGCYYNVMGFPVTSLKTILLDFNVNLWEYLH